MSENASIPSLLFLRITGCFTCIFSTQLDGLQKQLCIFSWNQEHMEISIVNSSLLNYFFICGLVFLFIQGFFMNMSIFKDPYINVQNLKFILMYYFILLSSILSFVFSLNRKSSIFYKSVLCVLISKSFIFCNIFNDFLGFAITQLYPISG